MYDDELLNRIREYFRQNQGTYTVEALRERMIRDGAPADAVDRVIAEMRRSPYFGPPPDAPARNIRQMRASTVLLVIGAGVVVNLVVLAAAIGLSVALESGIPFLLICVGAVVAEIWGAVAYGRKNPSVTVGLALGLVLSPVVAIILLVGACFAIIYSMDGRIGG